MSERARRLERTWRESPSLALAQAFLHELQRSGRGPSLSCLELAAQLYDASITDAALRERPFWLRWPSWWEGLELRLVEGSFWQYDERHLLFCVLEGFPFLLLPHHGRGPLRELTACSPPGLQTGRLDPVWLTATRHRCAADMLATQQDRTAGAIPPGWPDLDLTPALHDSLLTLSREHDADLLRHALATLSMLQRRTGAGSSNLATQVVTFDPRELLARLERASWDVFGEPRRGGLVRARRVLPERVAEAPPGRREDATGFHARAYAYASDGLDGFVGGWSRSVLQLELAVSPERWELSSREVWRDVESGMALT